jgi:hypothetical protein
MDDCLPESGRDMRLATKLQVGHSARTGGFPRCPALRLHPRNPSPRRRSRPIIAGEEKGHAAMRDFVKVEPASVRCMGGEVGGQGHAESPGSDGASPYLSHLFNRSRSRGRCRHRSLIVPVVQRFGRRGRARLRKPTARFHADTPQRRSADTFPYPSPRYASITFGSRRISSGGPSAILIP